MESNRSLSLQVRKQLARWEQAMRAMRVAPKMLADMGRLRADLEAHRLAARKSFDTHAAGLTLRQLRTRLADDPVALAAVDGLLAELMQQRPNVISKKGAEGRLRNMKLRTAALDILKELVASGEKLSQEKMSQLIRERLNLSEHERGFDRQWVKRNKPAVEALLRQG